MTNGETKRPLPVVIPEEVYVLLGDLITPLDDMSSRGESDYEL
jgi:hypothetical protein